MNTILITYTLSVGLHSEYTPGQYSDTELLKFKDKDYKLYKAGIRTSRVDKRTHILDCPPIIIARTSDNRKNIIVEGRHRLTLSALCNLGVDAYLVCRPEDKYNLPVESIGVEQSQLIKLINDIDFYHQQALDAGMSDCSFYFNNIKREWLSDELIARISH